MRKINFSPGPSALPETVLKRLQEGVFDYNGAGVGIFELGHRTKLFMGLVDETKDRLLKLIGASSSKYEVLFLTGGATQMFSVVPLNINTKVEKSAGYLVSGHWAKVALAEAQKFREVVAISSSESNGFKTLPEQNLDYSKYSYVHITSNNTIFGTQIKDTPKTADVPLVCDASSDILSREVKVDEFGMIYAGAQKNLGTAGVTIVIIRRDLIDANLSGLSTSLNLETYAKSNSLHNTPPVSAIVSVHEMLKWIEEEGGVSAIEERNTKKANLLYDSIDSSSAFSGYAEKEARSKMNITFKAQTEELEQNFIKFCESKNIIGLAGHRSVGGLRASLYNAITLEDVSTLVNHIKEFDAKNS